jgi:hypothetical protein
MAGISNERDNGTLPNEGVACFDLSFNVKRYILAP